MKSSWSPWSFWLFVWGSTITRIIILYVIKQEIPEWRIGYTAAHVGMMNHNISRILKMYAICVKAASWWIDCHVEDLDSFTIVKLEVALWTVLDCDASYCDIVTPIESQSLQNRIREEKICKVLLIMSWYCFIVRVAARQEILQLAWSAAVSYWAQHLSVKGFTIRNIWWILWLLLEWDMSLKDESQEFLLNIYCEMVLIPQGDRNYFNRKWTWIGFSSLVSR